LFKKLSDEQIIKYKNKYLNKNKQVPLWLKVCNRMRKLSYEIRVDKAVKTNSKYIYIKKGKVNRLKFYIRVSDHLPNMNNMLKILNIKVDEIFLIYEEEDITEVVNKILEYEKNTFKEKIK
jgi:ABC-type phosphate transport system ATPase subunit